MENKLRTILEQTILQHKKRKEKIATFTEKYSEKEINPVLYTSNEMDSNKEETASNSEFTTCLDGDIQTMKSLLEASKQITQALKVTFIYR